MAENIMANFKTLLLVMTLYSLGMSMFAYALPPETNPYLTTYSSAAQSLDSIGSQVQGNIEQQTNIPSLEVGALVFYSGNIILDLLLNFAFAIPQMLSLFITGILLIFNANAVLINQIQLFVSVLFLALYFVGLIQLISGIRSGRVLG